MEYRNVLHFADYGSPYKGNFIASLEVLEKELLKQNHTMFYLFPERTSKREWAKAKMNVNFLTNSFKKNIKIIRKIVKNNKIDIIHIHFYSFKILMLFKLLKLPCKIIVHLHGMFPEYKGIKKYIMKVLFKDTSVIGCSEAVTNSFLFKNDINSIRCIKNAIYFQRLEKCREIENLKMNFNSEKILIFGYNYFIKGVDIALEGIYKARQQLDNIECFVSISSNKQTFIKNVIEKFGNFPDWIKILPPIEEVASYYKNIDIFLSASRKEGFCYAIVEAAYMGCNIIASEIPAQKELDINDIFWFQSENTDELKDKILECIKNKAQNKKKITEQREYISEKYDINKWVQLILEEYKII